MLDALIDFLTAAGVLLVLVVLALLAVAVAVGVPALVGRMVYDRAQTEKLANPAALGFGAAFFTLLVGAFVLGVGLVWLS